MNREGRGSVREEGPLFIAAQENARVMTGLWLIFVLVFVLLLAAACSLLVLRTLGNRELREMPRFPRHRTRHHRIRDL